MVAHWRDSILNLLKTHGTIEACNAIHVIMENFPDLNWLKWVLYEARNIMRKKTWVPPQPEDIITITTNSQSRLVQNGEQLLQVLKESLVRLQAKLKGETPAVSFLWNEIDNGKFCPKNENSFSDYVKIHLDEDLKQKGIIVNREVQIHHGERTDIHVDAVVNTHGNVAFDKITVIIEVKGCWHQELMSAMETQLVNRYLNNNHCNYGLYLVGWFNSEKWFEGDYRKQQAPKKDIHEVGQMLKEQARKISQGELIIETCIVDTSL